MPSPSTAETSRIDALLADLNPDQRRAAETLHGPVRILAGAGSGKTRTITYRIANQIAREVAAPTEVLAVTFTERAAAELRHRLEELGIPPVRAATFHSAAWAQLRYFWPRVSGERSPEVISSKLTLLIPMARRLGIPAKDLALEIEWAKARCVPPDRYASAAAGRDLPTGLAQLAGAYADYEAAKAERGLIDYEDMLLRTAALIEEHDDVAQRVRARYRHFTVDEFQDVNPAQWRLLRAWLGPAREVCVVGDDAQTIYTFTGASSEYLLTFPSHFPDTTQIELTANYRSTPQVLQAANVLLAADGGTKRLRATIPDGPAPQFQAAETSSEEVRAVVSRVRKLVAEGTPPGEIAISYRVNSQSEPYEEALRQAGVPFVVRGAASFYELDGVREALRTLATATRRSPDGPPPPGDAAPRQPRRADRELERTLGSQLKWRRDREPPGEATRERWRNIGALVDVASREVDGNPALSFDELVELLLSRARAAREDRGNAHAVTLLSLHKAKGLEFDAVFIVGVEEGLIPITHARSDQEIAEERRLLYVGMTRARRHLWVSWALARERPGGRTSRRRPSRFLRPFLPPAEPAKRAAVANLDGPAAERAERLRAWRAQRSRQDGKPAFVVFSDRTLAELATACPGDERALLAVHGFGPAKAARYGREVLDILRGE